MTFSRWRHVAPSHLATFAAVACYFCVFALLSIGCARILGKGRDDDADKSPPVSQPPRDVDDLTPPPAPTLREPVRDPDSGAIIVSWTQPESNDAVRHELSLTSPDRGCASPIVSYATTGQNLHLASSLPGGTYLLCLSSFDASDNSSAATNQGTVALEQPTAIHYAALRGDGPETRTLVLGHIATAAPSSGATEIPAKEAIVAAPQDDLRIAEQASLQTTAIGTPTLTYVSIADGPNRAPNFNVMTARSRSDGFSQQSTLLFGRVQNAAVHSSFAFVDEAVSYLVQLAKNPIEGGGELIYAATSAEGNAAAITIDRTSGNGVFQDAAMVVDDEKQLHIIYVKDGRLTTRSKTADGWRPATTVATRSCSRIEQVAAAAQDGRIAIAYTCTRGTTDAATCALGLLSSKSTLPTAWQDETLVTIDDKAACLPFSPARPSVIVDADGRAHVAVRMRTDQGLVIGYAAETRPGTGITTLAPLNQPDHLSGFPKLAVNATGRVYALYLTSHGLELATEHEPGQFTSANISHPTAGAPGTILELADIAIVGGRSRSKQAFGVWTR